MATAAFGTKFMLGDGVAAAAVSIAAAPTGAVRTSNVVTITTTLAHGLLVNGETTIAGVTDSSFNGTFLVSEVVNTTNFKYRQVAADASSGAGTSTKQQQFTAVAELKEILPPPKELALIDATNHDSPNTYAEFIAGVRTAAAANLSGNYTNDAQKTQMEADLEAGTKRDYAVLFPSDLGYWRFAGFVAQINRDAPHSEALAFSAQVGVTGKSTFTQTKP